MQFRLVTRFTGRCVRKVKQQSATVAPVEAIGIMIRKPGQPGLAVKAGAAVTSTAGNGDAPQQFRKPIGYHLYFSATDLVAQHCELTGRVL